jgi:iron complex outermembrane recepter protein
MIRRKSVSSIMGLFAGMASSVSTYAQAPAINVLEEVIVTAERRAESLNSMAVAGEAFSSAEIERRGINEIEDLTSQTPGLSIKDSGVNRFVTIRGVGLNATTATITSGVAIHVDGVGLWGAGIALGNPFYDLERIEVLRGPQGTFVGQNSTGGAMFIISRAPKLGESDFFVEQTLGDYNLSDTVAATPRPYVWPSRCRNVTASSPTPAPGIRCSASIPRMHALPTKTSPATWKSRVCD